MKALLPWLCVVGLAIGLGVVYSAGRQKDADNAALREDSLQLQKLRAEIEEAKSAGTQAASDELTRLRKDKEDLLRLRNEVAQLRQDKQQLAAQVQTAQAQAQGAQAQIEALRAAPPTALPGQPNPAAPGGPPQVGAQLTPAQQINTCINNLRQIDGAKQQWALEQHKSADALPTPTDMAAYLGANTTLICPAGGVYTINKVNVPPSCSIPGHALPK